MRYLCPAILFMILSTIPVYSWDENDAKNIIGHTQKILIQIDNNLEIRPYIPYDIYGDALAELLRAREHYKENNYNKSYYYAALSSIKLETISLLAEAKKIREKIIVLERDYYREHCGTTIYQTLLYADMEKKGDSYRLLLYDKRMFKKGKPELTKKGEEYLNRVIDVLNAVTDSSITIAGHTSKTDYKDYSQRKADAVAQYFIARGIKKYRIKTYGLGNNEVVETPWGYKHLNCIELVVSGVTE